jgi:hypothetical protein
MVAERSGHRQKRVPVGPAALAHAELRRRTFHNAGDRKVSGGQERTAKISGDHIGQFSQHIHSPSHIQHIQDIVVDAVGRIDGEEPAG